MDDSSEPPNEGPIAGVGSNAHLSSRPSEGNSTANRRVSSPSPGRAALDLAIGDLASDQETVPFEEASSPSASSGPRPQSLILKPIGVNLFPRLPLPPPPPPPPVDESSSFTAADQPLTMKLPASALRHSSTGSHSSASSHSGQASEISLSTLSANGAASGPAGGVPSPEEDITIFSELSTLRPNSSGGKDSQQQLTWKETARWVKYEENVEENGTRWSKPYVSTVNLGAFLELKNSLSNGIVILDSASSSLDQVVDEFLQLLRIKNLVSNDEANQIYQLLLLQKRHLFQNKKSIITSIGNLRQNSSSNFLKLISRSSSKINCTTVDTSTLNNHPLAEQSLASSEMTRSQSNYDLENGAINLETNGNGNGGGLTKNSFSSSNLVQTGKNTSGEFKFNNAFMKKIPLNALSNNILVAEVDFLATPISGFVRLHSPANLGDITEVCIPTKFIYIYLGPKTIGHSSDNYTQIGRALATLMSDSVFRSVALKTQSVESLLVAIDEFLGEAPILPPNLWDPATRIEPPERTPNAETRKGHSNSHSNTVANLQQPPVMTIGVDGKMVTTQSFYNAAFECDGTGNGGANIPNGNGGGWNSGAKVPGYFLSDQIELDSEDEEEIEREKNGLTRTGRLFGGLINDVKRKVPHYASDFTDAFALQSVASVIFLYFACLAPIITFGGLLGDATGNNIATMESLVCGALCGIVYGLFSGQPLTILGSTGPVLVFETIVYDFCTTSGYNYLAFRFWIGMWIAGILLFFVATDLSYLVCYITRFTEENFASLISVIFIYKAIEKVLDISHHYPMNNDPDRILNYECSCKLPNQTDSFSVQSTAHNETALDVCLKSGGILFGRGCGTPTYVPNVFLFSVILFFITYILSVKLKDFRQTRFFGVKTRQLISDFAVPIAIMVTTLADYLSGIRTPKLQVPSQFEPTLPTRQWLVQPFVSENPVWLPVVAVLPALLGTILIFMDQQITAVIVNRKENKLKKGCGYHLDLFILALLIGVCSLFGLPWFVAATVLSITHVNSLTMHSESAAPGDKPKFLGCREQRLTQVAIFVLCGLSIFFTPLLQQIPMPVLYGVFLYMGVSSLKGSQFIERILIVFMPPKYQPDYMFLRRVNITRVHLFTAIQFICFVFLWVIKSYKPISILFPLMLVVILGIRWALNCLFSQAELKILDDTMPESKRKKKERAKAKLSAAAAKQKEAEATAITRR